MNEFRVLFVDDEANILSGLRRMLRASREPWEVCFAEDGQQALALLAAEPFDVVVSDMRMPGISGAKLLEQVRQANPGTARIVLSGHADQEGVVAAAGPAQQYLAKPCDPEALVRAVRQVLAARSLVTDPTWRDRIGGLTSLPKPPAVYAELVALAENPETTLVDLVDVVQRDISLTTEVLKLVNSAFFALVSHVDNVERAVGLLGLDVIQALALAGTVFKPSSDLSADLDAAELGRRAVQVALLVRRIAAAEGWDKSATSDLCLAGLLHDVGLLVLTGLDPDGYERLRKSPPEVPEPEAQLAAFGITVAQASAHILGLWGFSQTALDLLVQPPVSLNGTQPALDAAPSATSAAGHAIAFARHQVGADGLPVSQSAYLDEARLARWTAACSLG